MKSIYLVGFMGTGKTAVGEELAKRLSLKFLDLDDLIEEKEKLKIMDIFAQKGEPYFRRLEKEMVKGVCQKKGLVVACGGGVVLDKENVKNLRKTGTIVCLSARPEVILERTKGYTYRPLLNVEDPEKKIKELLKFRAPYYAQADYTINTSDLGVEEITRKIIEIIKRDQSQF